MQEAPAGDDKRQKARFTFEQMFDGPCKYHNGPFKLATHTIRQCSWTRQIREQGGVPPPPPPPGGPPSPARAANNNNDAYLQQHANYHIFVSEPNYKRSWRQRIAEVNAIVPPVPKYLNWSETPITWRREDQPELLPYPGGYAMVPDPLLISNEHTCRFSRVLVDGGINLNLLYRASMKKMGIRECDLQPSSTLFHDVVLGHPCSSLGKIRLDVIFGSKENFNREPIWFEVVNLTNTYPALLGCPALAKFMVVPHYAYLKMKLPGTNAVITVSGCYRRSMECASEGAKIAEALVIAAEKREIMRNVAFAQQEVPTELKPARDMVFQPSKETKQIPLDPSEPAKCVTIGVGLDNK